MWRVRWRELGRIKRKFFASRDSADAHAAFANGQSFTARQRIATLPASVQQTLLAALDKANERGVDLLAAVCAAKQTVQSVAIGDVIGEMVGNKRNSGLSERYLSNVEWMLNEFANGRERLPISAITLQDVEKFLSGKNLASRPCYRGRISNLMKFAVRRGYCSENPCARLEPIYQQSKTPAVMTVPQVLTCIKVLKANPTILAWFVLSTFAGLRPEEADNTEWSAINFEEKLIRVEAQTSKIRQRRIVYPQPMVFDWLKYAKQKRSKLPLVRSTRIFYLKPLRKALKLKEWPRDFTRHTAASYWLAESSDVAKVSSALGNSPSILMKHYKAIVTKADAKEFWKIKP